MLFWSIPPKSYLQSLGMIFTKLRKKFLHKTNQVVNTIAISTPYEHFGQKFNRPGLNENHLGQIFLHFVFIMKRLVCRESSPLTSWPPSIWTSWTVQVRLLFRVLSDQLLTYHKIIGPEKLVRKGRVSFPSGHSAGAFLAATYSFLLASKGMASWRF